ncbi:hypothetical protein B0H13DRAFT_2336657 [Mycena leptocephala]|nr:hypothetical protein B0H13DRAFT_2336657 [Mycena leptocephala]
MDPVYQDLILRSILDNGFTSPPAHVLQGNCHGVGCDDPLPQYRCLDCLGAEDLCISCLLKEHFKTPLHRIEMWTGRDFTTTNLKAVGMWIELGHSYSDVCPNPIVDHTFKILDPCGVHDVCIYYCGCTHAPGRGAQLRAARLFPNEPEFPTIALTSQMVDMSKFLNPPVSCPPIRKKKRKLAACQTDGEPERHWASLNSLPTNAREMGPGARRDCLDDHFSVLPEHSTTASERPHLQDDWTNTAAIAAWDAAFEGLRDFCDVDAPMQSGDDMSEAGYVEIDGDVPEREWVEAKPGDPEPFPMSWKEYRKILLRMPKSSGSRKKLPKVKLFAAPVEMEVKMEEID